MRGATEAINLVAQSWGRQNIQKDDEIVVTAGSGSEDIRDDLSRDGQILREYRQPENGDVAAAGDEALVFSEPVVPLRVVGVSGLDGAVTVGDRICGIAHVGCGF